MHTECRDCENRPKQIEKLKTAVELAKPISVILITVILIVGILALFIAGSVARVSQPVCQHCSGNCCDNYEHYLYAFQLLWTGKNG